MSGDKRGRAVRRPRVVRQPAAGPGPLGELKRLLYQLYLEAGAPTLEHIAALIATDDDLPGAPEKDTIGRCLGSPDLPASQADVIAIATVLAREAAWDPAEAAAQARALWIQARMLVPAGRPLGEFTDPIALEVHRPVEVAIPPEAPELPVLPTYIPRDHDRRLAEAVSRAAGGTSLIAVLVGGSSTGKTRACWEAVRALPPGWRLWHPIFPDRAAAFLAGLQQVVPRTVVWLNEAQFYLLTGDLLTGERVAAGLRDLLRDPQRGPVLVLGTIWPRYWHTLTSPPDPGDEDAHPHARELLVGAAIEVPTAFTGPALSALSAAARADPRLAAAQDAQDGQVTQFLAGVPALMERYLTAPPTARAMIDAALDARALGHGPAIPYSLLEAATPAYLTDQQWEEDAGEDWLEQALAYTAAPCRGARGPLTRVRPRPGHPTLSQPHYRLADYLEQVGRVGRAFDSPPPPLWDALITHASQESLLPLASRARSRGLYRCAFRLLVAAVNGGDITAIGRAADILDQTGRPEEALALYQQAAEAHLRAAAVGENHPPRDTARMLEKAGRPEEALALYQQAAEVGEPRALEDVARVLLRTGRPEEALAVYHQAAESYPEKAQPGSSAGWITKATIYEIAAGMLQEAGRPEEALALYQQAAKAGHLWALEKAARVHEAAGRAEEALALYQQAAKAGVSDALEKAAGMLRSAGRTEEALAWLQPPAQGGNLRILEEAAKTLEEAGRAEEALALYQRAGRMYLRLAKTGHIFSLAEAARMLEKTGRPERALTFYQRVVDAYLQEATRTGSPWMLILAAGTLRRTGRPEEALALYQQATEAGIPGALEDAADVLDAMGRTTEAVRLRRFGFEPSGQIADPWEGRLPMQFPSGNGPSVK